MDAPIDITYPVAMIGMPVNMPSIDGSKCVPVVG
jgi:hypothetical protein